uniref:Uncharacterized protein n=1 Tax=Bubo bubo TaxID=30461 RepID=A0A8C0IIB5_BUBBB
VAAQMALALGREVRLVICLDCHLPKSLKQRLGKSNIQARLGRPAGPLARGAMGGRGLSMGQRGLPRGAMRGGRGARALLRGGVPLRGQYRG